MKHLTPLSTLERRTQLSAGHKGAMNKLIDNGRGNKSERMVAKEQKQNRVGHYDSEDGFSF